MKELEVLEGMLAQNRKDRNTTRRRIAEQEQILKQQQEEGQAIKRKMYEVENAERERSNQVSDH